MTNLNVPGGGIWVSDTTITINHSIVSDNQSGGGNPDIHPAGTSVIDANYSLLGTAVTPDTGADNLFNNAPLFGPLASNGGPTETHALLGLSPAINAGDLNFDDAAMPTDQRGAPFVRVAGFRVDIGAFELQGSSSTNSADFDTDGDIDGRDFLLWQRGFGTPNASKYDGDADDNDDVDSLDLGIWQSQFGSPAPVAAASELSAIRDQPSAELIDAVMAFELVRDGQVAETRALDEEPAFAETLAETLADHVFAAEAIVPAGVFVDETERPDANSTEDEKAETPWLADVLLERVFG